MRLRLEQAERVIAKTRAHPKVLRGPLLIGYLLLGTCSYALAYLARIDLPAGLATAAPVLSIGVAVLGAVLFVWWCVRPLWKWSRLHTCLTNRRLLAASGPRDERRVVSLYSVHGINVQARTTSGPGRLRITAGDRQVNYPDVPGVHRLAQLVQGAIMALPRGLKVDGVKMEANESTDGTEHG